MLAVVDYEAMRAEAAVVASSKTSRVREYVAKLGKAQRAAEETLEMSVCNFCAILLGGLRLGGLGHKPPLSLTRAPHHTPSPDSVCSCV